MLSSRMVCLALLRRLVVCSSVVRKAFAISGMLKRHKVCKVRATCDSLEMEGWQQVNIILNWSSCISDSENRFSSAALAVHSDLRKWAAWEEYSRLYFSRFTIFSALFFAT